jgi:hypothetical protein
MKLINKNPHVNVIFNNTITQKVAHSDTVVVRQKEVDWRVGFEPTTSG